jgi:hypothetical protein
MSDDAKYPKAARLRELREQNFEKKRYACIDCGKPLLQPKFMRCSGCADIKRRERKMEK